VSRGRIVADSGDVQTAVDRLAAALNLSVLVEDRRQRPVWWSTRGAVDQTRTSTILDRHVDPQAAEVVRRYGLDRAQGPVRTPPMPERGMWARWCVPARHEGRLAGYLWVLDPDGTVTEEGLGPLVECAELAAAVLATAASAALDMRRRRNELIDILLAGHDNEAAGELARLEHLPHDIHVQVEAPAHAGGWALPIGMSAHVVRRRPRKATSGHPVPLVQLRLAADRAQATLRAAAAGARISPITWDSLGAWHLVVAAPADLSVDDLHPAAAVLRTQPRDELLTTTRVVLDHGGDVAAAAEDLHVHRTTLYYRLDRIRDLTGVDLRQGQSSTHLQMALWLDAYRRTGLD
jgi:hypothetical protein